MKILLVAAAVLVLLVLGFWLANRTAHPRGGLENGQLKACPDRPNCIYTGAAGETEDPLHFRGDQVAAQRRLKQIMRGFPRATLLEEGEGYLHYAVRSALFRFIDDVEFSLDDATGSIHIRSASRLGYSDLGVNRKRVETIRKAWGE